MDVRAAATASACIIWPITRRDRAVCTARRDDLAARRARRRMLAAIASSRSGSLAWYMWGASSDEDRNLMPNHAAQWAAMRWAGRAAAPHTTCGHPDEVGADPDAYQSRESWGQGRPVGCVSFSRQGFGGRVIRYTGAWDMPLSRTGYALYRLALRVRERESG